MLVAFLNESEANLSTKINIRAILKYTNEVRSLLFVDFSNEIV